MKMANAICVAIAATLATIAGNTLQTMNRHRLEIAVLSVTLASTTIPFARIAIAIFIPIQAERTVAEKVSVILAAKTIFVVNAAGTFATTTTMPKTDIATIAIQIL